MNKLHKVIMVTFGYIESYVKNIKTVWNNENHIFNIQFTWIQTQELMDIYIQEKNKIIESLQLEQWKIK